MRVGINDRNDRNVRPIVRFHVIRCARPSFRPSIHNPSIFFCSIHSSIRPVCPSFRPAFPLSIRPFIRRPSIRSFVHPLIIFIVSLSVSPSICPFVCPSRSMTHSFPSSSSRPARPSVRRMSGHPSVRPSGLPPSDNPFTVRPLFCTAALQRPTSILRSDFVSPKSPRLYRRPPGRHLRIAFRSPFNSTNACAVLLIEKRRRGHRQQVRDEHRRLRRRNLLLGAARPLHLRLRHQHQVLSLRRPDLRHEVRFLDVRR